MLKKIIENNWIDAHAIIGFYPANQVNQDDIQLYKDDSTRKEPLVTFYGLRQQNDRDQEYFQCLSDFVQPRDEFVEGQAGDYLGLFACSAGFKVDECVAQYEKDMDDYNVILIKTLADRLAEALAEKLHEEVRTEHWGYAEAE